MPWKLIGKFALRLGLYALDKYLEKYVKKDGDLAFEAVANIEDSEYARRWKKGGGSR